VRARLLQTDGLRDGSGTKHDFLTSNFKLRALTIADLYRMRWQVEQKVMQRN
jgi:IS4 transposase